MLERCIIDKQVVIEKGAKVGAGDDNAPNKALPEQINTGLTLVGKGSVVPEEVTIGRNVVVHPFSDAKSFGKRKRVASGMDVGKSMR